MCCFPTFLARAGGLVTLQRFPAIVASTTPLHELTPLRPGLSNEGLDTADALRLVGRQLCSKAVQALRHGTAYTLRSATLWPLPKPSRGPKRRKTQMLQQSRIIFHHAFRNNIGEMPKSGGKLAAIWVANMEVVQDYLKVDWMKGGENQFNLGIIRYITSVSPNGRQVSVQPPIEALPLKEGGLLEVDTEETALVLTVLLEDLHQFFFAYEAIRLFVQALGSSLPSQGLADDVAVRNLLGLKAEAVSSEDSPHITEIFGAAHSEEREEFIRWTESVFRTSCKPPQINLLRS